MECTSLEVNTITRIFFDAECLKQERFAHDLSLAGKACPLVDASNIVHEYTRGWRMESMMGAFVNFLINLSLMQLGGIPDPVDYFSTLCWTIWMSLQVCPA